MEGPVLYLLLVLATVFGILCYAVADAVAEDVQAQTTFATPADAGQALRTANGANDQNKVLQVLGPGAEQLLNSGDPVEDKEARQSFITKYDQMNRWVAMTDGSEILYIGADNYPFPIPLAQNSERRWYFNTEAGADEMLARRIGRNELLAIDASYAIASAQEFYFNDAHQYAQRIISTPGTKDGLYWPSSGGNASSPLSGMEVFAQEALTSATPGTAPIIDGYEFRILTAQGGSAPGGAKNYLFGGKLEGGFAVLAYPAKYGDSGVMTFVLGRNGVVYQKDLGEKTSEIGGSITTYDPGDSWIPAE
jgi:Protein of unknown function (DUF2950)